MLGVRLAPELERQLDRHALDMGKPKSVMVRDWIIERLERESLDQQLIDAARVAAETDSDRDWIESDFDD